MAVAKSIFKSIFKGYSRGFAGGGTTGPDQTNLLAYWPLGSIVDGKLIARAPVSSHTTQQVKSSGFSGAGSATVTGLLTTDTITASGDAPTCSVVGTLTFPGPDCWDIDVHRDGVLWASWKGINVGKDVELDASGNGHHLIGIVGTTITERTDGSGTNYANEVGFTVADGLTHYGNSDFTNLLPAGTRFTLGYEPEDGEQSPVVGSALMYFDGTISGDELVDANNGNNATIYAWCPTFAGTETLTLAHLAGTETVVAGTKVGTSTVTIAAGQLSFSAGTLRYLELSDGTKLVFESRKNNFQKTIYNVDGTYRHGTLSVGKLFDTRVEGSYLAQYGGRAVEFLSVWKTGDGATLGSNMSRVGDVFTSLADDTVQTYIQFATPTIPQIDSATVITFTVVTTANIQINTGTYQSIGILEPGTYSARIQASLTNAGFKIVNAGGSITGVSIKTSLLNDIIPYGATILGMTFIGALDAPGGCCDVLLPVDSALLAADTDEQFHSSGAPKYFDPCLVTSIDGYCFKTNSGLALFESAIPTPIYVNTSLSAPTTDAVANIAAAQKVLVASQKERVAIVGLGDSNQTNASSGWQRGFDWVAAKYFNHCWATPWTTAYNIQPTSFLSVSSIAYSAVLARSGAPVELTTEWNSGFLGYGYVNSGSTAYSYLQFLPHELGGINRDFTFTIGYGKYSGWTGNFRPTITNAAAGILTQGDVVSTGGDSSEIATTSLTDTVGVASNVAMRAYAADPTAKILAPYFGAYQMVESDKANGFQCSSYIYSPGGSSVDYIEELNLYGSTALTNYLTAVRSRLGAGKYVVIEINAGVNDRNEADLSIGPVGGLDSRTKDGYKDNIIGIINIFRGVYTANSWSQDNLYFWITAGHPLTVEQDTNLVGFRLGAKELAEADSNIFAVDLSKLTTTAEMLSEGWYEGSFDVSGNYTNVGPYHLSGPLDMNSAKRCGYNVLSLKQFNALYGKE